MNARLLSGCALAALFWASPPRQLTADDAPSDEEKKAFELIDRGLGDLLNLTLDDMKEFVKKGGKDAPKLLEGESRANIGYFVYTGDGKRACFHAGKMIRLDQPAPRGMSAVVMKKFNLAPIKGPRFEWMERAEKGDEVVHRDFTTKIQSDNEMFPFTYTLQFTTRANGQVVCSVLDTERVTALRKVSAKK